MGHESESRLAGLTVSDIQAKKARGERIVALTAYDLASTLACEAAGAEILLVGDSLGMVMLGHETTLPVTMDEMILHARSVSRAARRALVVGDMPFMAYHAGARDAVRNAGRFVKEAGVQAVKLEGGSPSRVKTVRAVLDAEIPVMGHIGLTPQSFHKMGGYRVQGKTTGEAQRLLDEARALEEAGAFALVLEGVPRELARDVTAALRIPTIGIGAGSECDGQILVFHDVLGLLPGGKGKFVRRYLDGFALMRDALSRYAEDVRSGAFPSDAESYHAPKGEPVRFPKRGSGGRQ
jgi:3-methyl-2-oxobutanoate hydroxymethyltransferase